MPAPHYAFDMESLRFAANVNSRTTPALEDFSSPLSVILQVTRRCNLDCVFCSETEPIPDPTLSALETMRGHLHGVRRVYISGGEPLLRKDIAEVLRMFKSAFVVGVPTNATLPALITPDLARLVDFVNIGFEGPRAITEKVRGRYDDIVNGIFAFRSIGVPITLTSVVISSALDAVPFTCQTADLLEVRKLKLVCPIAKGNALHLANSEFPSSRQMASLFSCISEFKSRFGWKPIITLTAWTKEVEGYSILVYPDGSTHAWPVYDQPDKVLYLGNLLDEPIIAIWERYPFKRNHLRKYFGESIYVC